MKVLYLFILSLSVGFLASCNKCDATNSTGGDIIDNAIVRVVHHPSGPLMVTDAGQVNFDIEVSFDNGFSYDKVDFGKYAALYLPTRAECHAGYERIVNISGETVKYTINITECGCDNKINVANWVLIPSVPSDYEYIYEINFED